MALAGALVAVTGFAVWRTELRLGHVIDGLGRLGWLVALMWPPSHGGWLGEFSYALLETVAMAFLGTFLASVAALPLGFLGARNVVTAWLVHVTVRRALDGVRGVDALIWALMFVNVVGLGPFAGVMALALSDVGTLAKLYAEAIENLDRGQIEGLRAAGADRLGVARFAIWPQVGPIVLGQALYFFESNTRSATIVGVVGAGGIGFQLAERIRLNNWNEVCFLVLMILGAVTVIDVASQAVRLQLIGVRPVQ
jgi:phosphonate transport system permease protein